METIRSHAQPSISQADSTSPILPHADQKNDQLEASGSCELKLGFIKPIICLSAGKFRLYIHPPMNSTEKPKNPWLSVGGIVGAVLGFYCGLMLVIPIVVAFGAGALLKKMDAPKLDPFKVGSNNHRTYRLDGGGSLH